MSPRSHDHAPSDMTGSPSSRAPARKPSRRWRSSTELYGNHDPADADVVVALGGDGLMLQTLHRHMRSGKPIYGMHRGTVGFLMNEFSDASICMPASPRRGNP